MVSDNILGNKTSFLMKIPSLCLGIFSLILVITSLRHWQEAPPVRTDFIAPPEGIEHFSFGYSEVMADIFWIRAIQDFDFCDFNAEVCIQHSWLFKMLDATTNLSPHFRIPYAAGGLALTVVASDVDGATKIFEKGVKAFPNDWPILYRAAYHYMYEIKDNKRAAELLVQAGKNGAPSWVFTLAGRLYSDAGNLELAEALLQDMINTKQDPVLIKRLQDKIESMKKNH